MEQGEIQVYYGSGLGKTSAAIGNAIRAASTGATAAIVTFMKSGTGSEYFKRLEPEIRFFRFERNPEGFDTLSDAEKQEERQNIQNGLAYAKKVLSTEECDFLVLDEVLGLVEEGMATEEDILNVLAAKSVFATVILTGRDLPAAIAEKADNIYEIVPRKTDGKGL